MDIDMQLAIITIALTLTSCVFLVISVASHIDVYIDDRLILIRLITGILLLVLCITYYHVANYYIDYYEPEANINFTNIEKNIESETNVDVEMGASIQYNGDTHTNDIIVPTDTTFDQLLSIIKYTQQYINYNQYIEEHSSMSYENKQLLEYAKIVHESNIRKEGIDLANNNVIKNLQEVIATVETKELNLNKYQQELISLNSKLDNQLSFNRNLNQKITTLDLINGDLESELRELNISNENLSSELKKPRNTV